MYAVIEWGGKQYKVEQDSVLEVEKIAADEGKEVIFDKVLMYSDGEKIYVGNPYIDGVEVKASVVEQKKDKKVIIFKFRKRHKYRVKRGHRQPVTRVKIASISK